MSKKKQAKSSGNLNNLAKNLADAGRAEYINLALKDWKEKETILDGSLYEHLLAKFLDVDVSWVFIFNEVLTGKLHGATLWGAEKDTSVQLAQALLLQKHGFIQHPLISEPEPIHPRAKEKIEKFIKGK